MRWDYTSDIRDEFGKGVHRDILIVPHATNVIKVAGSEPIITSKMPEWEWVGTEPNKKPIPAKDSHGNYIYKPVEWVITNKDIVKEKFKYSSSLNSDNNLTFSSCNAAQIQFTIRNEKEFNEEEGYWEPVIPNLQKYEFVETDPNGTERKIVGELLGNACVEAYMYFNGDSSTLIYLGMFKIEEDKLVDDGYSRQITGYDFLMWLREIDIFNWYKHLFEGINKLQSDYEDMTNESGEEDKKPDDWDENWIREPKEKWTVKEALTDLIEHLAAYDPVVYEEEIDPETKEKKTVMKVGNTITNPYEYGRDDYEEGNGYSGLGMPIMIDEDILTKGNARYIPSEPGENEYERYGYMDILELEFYQDPKIMNAGALSAGKFLEDIGLLAGRYPIIRTDRFEDGDFVDPETIQPTPEEKHPSKYNNYERCILSFKPLPSVDEDDNIDKIPESKFDNSDIVKGFQHDYYQVQDILVTKFILDDNTEINYHKLNKAQYAAEQKSQIQTFTCTNNMFCSYLVTKSDNDDIKKMINKYKVIRNKLFGQDIAKGTVSPDALFNQGYNNIRNRIYTPYQLTTFADPVRDIGDRIKIDFTDKITGEESHFYTYILEREFEGIQKMMDKYTAKGDMRSPVFTNYQTSSRAGSNDKTDVELMTPFDLIEYMRNCGYRLLDEPMNCEAVFCKGGYTIDGGTLYKYHQIVATALDPEYGEDYAVVDYNYLINNPTMNPIHVYIRSWDDRERYDCGMYEVKDFDIVYEFENTTSAYLSPTLFIFYNGRWYPACMLSDSRSFYKEIASVCDFEPDRLKEGAFGQVKINMDYIEEEQDFIKVTYVSAYDVLTINSVPTQVNYSEYIYNNSTYKQLTFIPPGLWSDLDLSGGDFNHIALSDSITYRSLHYTEDNIYDGSTATIVYDNYEGNNVNVEEYDYIAKEINGVNHIFVFYDGSWKDMTARKHQIADITTKAKIEAIPEIAAIMLAGNPQGEDVKEYKRLYGQNTDTLTINGQKVNVEPFDALLIDDDYGNNYLMYMPNKVWYEFFDFDDWGPTMYIPIRGGLSQIKPYVQLKWTDPPDIDTWEPYPCSWEGTTIVRKEDSAPLHRWDGKKVVSVQTRDKYKTKGYKDEDIKMGKTYYYGFFPYYTADNSDPEHPIRYYTFTKTIKVETGNNSLSPVINSIDVDNNTATIDYTLTQPDSTTFKSIKLYGKIGENPNCDDTDDVDVTISDKETSKDVTGLTYDSTYYFCIVTTDNNDDELSSNVMSCTTGEDESRHLYPKVKLNNEANKYTFDQALIDWYNAGLSDQRSYIDGYPTDHIQITNDFYKIHNDQGAHDGTIDLGGGWIITYSYSANQHTYNRDFRTKDVRLTYNGTDVAGIYGGTALEQDIIVTFSNNGNGTASVIFFPGNANYMYDRLLNWETSNYVLTPNGNNAILFHDYLKAHQK